MPRISFLNLVVTDPSFLRLRSPGEPLSLRPGAPSSVVLAGQRLQPRVEARIADAASQRQQRELSQHIGMSRVERKRVFAFTLRLFRPADLRVHPHEVDIRLDRGGGESFGQRPLDRRFVEAAFFLKNQP